MWARGPTLAVTLAVVAVGFAVVLGAVPSPDAGEGAGEHRGDAVTLTRSSGRPFVPSSAFNTPIGSGVRVDQNSTPMVRSLSGRGHATVSLEADVPPVYDADEDTPRMRLDCRQRGWGPCDLERGRVPVPGNAEPAPGPDGSMVVIDWSTRRVFEFWRFRKERGTVRWGAVLPLDGTGTGNGERDPGRYGAVGAGVSRLAGLVRTFELTNGRIKHALVGASGFSCQGTHRYPAVKTDGWATTPGCVPQGARVQLDPRVDCARLPGIRTWEVTVCRALQEYGWYNIDNADVGRPGFTIQFENARGVPDVYRQLGLVDFAAVTAIPLHRLRVLQRWDSFEGSAAR